MDKRIYSVLAVAFALAACGGDGAGGGDEAQPTDTTIVQSQDTVQVPTVVPTQDTIIKKVDVDTVQGEGQAPQQPQQGEQKGQQQDTTQRP